ncbi:hypothetical protein SAY87_027096 [Trapa incisa]|uniref:Uncharacterized protein n=1 Tax=Trapa incisa TaxID=236973 RepID=A0AAN7JLT3_9MYRT|nr:hypothetical protein SAY87_027096 [Trapa incisa]
MKKKRRRIRSDYREVPEMFGRVRISSTSPDDLERSTAKLLKHDSLSIYESTLLKLRVGSQRAKYDLLLPEDMHNENDEMTMEVDNDYSTILCPESVMPSRHATTTGDDGDDSCGNTSSRSSVCLGAFSSKRHSCSRKTVSIHHMFSRYKDSKTASPSCDQMMTRQNNYPPSVLSNPGKHFCPLDKDQQLETECIGSIAVSSM